MESPHAETNTYRLIVTRRNASEILLLPNGSGLTVPRVEIHPHQRIAEQLTEKVEGALRVEAYCLLIPNLPTCSRDGEPKCAVMESVPEKDDAPTGAFWVPRVAADGHVEASEVRLIQEALKELRACAADERAGPFARPGWLSELFRWTQEQIAQLGLRLTGAFQQLNASPTFSLIRLETEAGAVWFKATGQPNSHELPVTVALARLFPHSVPQILGVHRGWNGWLSVEAAGTSLDQIIDLPVWEHAAGELAELQIASVTKRAVNARELSLYSTSKTDALFRMFFRAGTCEVSRLPPIAGAFTLPCFGHAVSGTAPPKESRVKDSPAFCVE